MYFCFETENWIYMFFFILFSFIFFKDRAYTVFYMFTEKILHYYKTWYVFMDKRQTHATEI